MFYITTTKGWAKGSKLCESLASVLPRGVFERRGRKPIEGVVARARKLGKSRILLVGEGSLGFIAVSAGSWEWAGEALRFAEADFHPAPETPPETISGSGRLSEAFGRGKGEVSAKISQGSLSFIIRRKKAGPELRLVKR